MRGRAVTGQGTLGQIAAIAVLLGLDEGEAPVPVQDIHPLAHQNLPVARTARPGEQIGERDRDPRGFARHEAFGLDPSLERHMGDTPVRRREAAVVHSPSTPGRAARIARAPWPTPPFGRAGAAAGCQP